MKKLWLWLGVLMVGALVLVGQNLPNPQYTSDSAFQYRQSTTCTSAGCNPSAITSLTGAFQGLSLYKVSWTVDGAPVCSFTLDSATNSAAAPTVGGVIGATNCAAQGTATSAANTYVNFIRLTPTISGSGSVTFTILGYVNGLPASATQAISSLTGATQGQPAIGTSGGALVSSPIYLDASAFAGADSCVKMRAAYTAAGANITVDARAFTGAALACSVSPFPSTASTPLLLGCNSAYSISVTWVVVSGTRIEGCDLPNGLNGTNGSMLFAAAGFTGGVPMLCWGINGVCGTGPAGNGFNAFNALVEWVQIDCKGPSQTGTATIGVQNMAGQENTGLSHFKIMNCALYGADWEASKTQHSFLEFGQIFIDAANPGICAAATRMLKVGAAGGGSASVPDVTFRQLTITIQGCTAAGGSIAPTAIVSIDNCQNCIFENAFHVEGTQSGDLVSGDIAIDLGALAGNNSVWIKGASCGNMTHIGGSNSVCVDVENNTNVNVSIRNVICPSSCDTVLLDSQAANTLTPAANANILAYEIGSTTNTVYTTAAGNLNAVQLGQQNLTFPSGSTSAASITWKGFAAGVGLIAAGSTGMTWSNGTNGTVTIGASGVSVAKTLGFAFSSTGQSTGSVEEGIGTVGKGIVTVDTTATSNHLGYVFSGERRALIADTGAITTITAVFSFPTLPAIAQTYVLTCEGAWTSNGTESLTISTASNVASTTQDVQGWVYTAPTGTVTSLQAHITATGNQTVVGPVASAGAGTTQPWRLTGVIQEPAASGTFAVAFTGTVGTSAVIKAGSYCQLSASN